MKWQNTFGTCIKFPIKKPLRLGWVRLRRKHDDVPSKFVD